MQKHLLITVSCDASALFGVRFVNSFFRQKETTCCTLLYVAANPQAALSLEEIHREMEQVQLQIEQARRRGQEALNKAMDFLLAAGFLARNIETKFAFREQCTAVDIVREGVKGMYDAIVLGRRGISRLEELVEDSVSKLVADMSFEIPIWVCRMPEHGRSDVLLCADGSDESLRAADHVGFILAGEPSHKIRIFHVWDPAKEDYLEALDIVDQARALLMKSGIGQERLSDTIKRGRGVARLIKAELEAKCYAAVCVGCTGADRPPLQRLFLGSVSRDLLRTQEKTALWISH